MARAYGINATLIGQFEDTYGVAPGGNHQKLHFISSSLGSEQGLIEDDVLGFGRDQLDPIQDVINVDGDIVVPVDLRNMGFWLKLVFGALDTGGSDPYTHVWTSGKEALPSATLEVGHPKVPRFNQNLGCVGNTLAFNFQRSGGAAATIGVIAQGEAPFVASQGGTPSTRAYRRFNQFQGSVRMGTDFLGNIVAAREIVFDNGYERVEVIRDDGKIAGADPTKARFSGALDVRFADTELMEAAEQHTPIDLTFQYRINDDQRLTILATRIFLPKPKLVVTGPGGVQATYEFQAAMDFDAGQMLTATLVNDVASY